MHIDLVTLYLLAIGTLLAGAAMTLWERRARPERRRELALLAAGYATLAIGCLAATARHALPGVLGSALANLAIVAGYLLVFEGVAALNGRRHQAASLTILAMQAVLWAIGGAASEDVLWDYVSAYPIAIVCGATAWEVLRCGRLSGLPSRRVVALVSGTHALIYTFRSTLLPALAALDGAPVLEIAGKVTMYGGVLYSVMLPMGLLALVREEAHDQLRTLSLTDYLTGLGNRQWFFEQGARLLADARRPLSLLAIDLDHFKTINDRHGHAAGDEVLKAFAAIVRRIAGADAVLARIGGEEFAALLPDCDSARAAEIGRAIAQHFAASAVPAADGTPVRTTLSIGVARTEDRTTDLAALLSAADNALYRAKARGRNRIELADTVPLSAVA